MESKPPAFDTEANAPRGEGYSQVQVNSIKSGAGSALAPEVIAAFELQQLSAYYRVAPPALRSLAWNLLQTALSPKTRPVLLALALALDLLENEEAIAYHAAQGDGETFPTVEASIAFFWSGRMGTMEAPELATETPESERGPITSAARVLFSLPQLATGTGSELAPELAKVLKLDETASLSSPVTTPESDLLAWLHRDLAPCHVWEEPAAVLDALHPTGGGFDLQDVNLSRRAWWLSMRRLQARLLEFAALEIPEPKDFTEADVEAMRSEQEGGLS